MMWMNGMSWWMWLLMIGGTIGFWAVVAMAIQAVLEPRLPRGAAAPEPSRLLDERFARGEIDTDQYLQTRRLISRSSD